MSHRLAAPTVAALLLGALGAAPASAQGAGGSFVWCRSRENAATAVYSSAVFQTSGATDAIGRAFSDLLHKKYGLTDDGRCDAFPTRAEAERTRESSLKWIGRNNAKATVVETGWRYAP
jgi:hypothetical protein